MSLEVFFEQWKQLVKAPACKSLLISDSSFMETYKQLQEQQDGKVATPIVAGKSAPVPVSSESYLDGKPGDTHKNTGVNSVGKLAFSFKQKSKLVAPAVKLYEEEDVEKDARSESADTSIKSQKSGMLNSSIRSLGSEVAFPSPSDESVKKAADRLATFVAKNGRQIEHITRQKNPGNTPFKFLFDESCADYKYYEYRLSEEEKALKLDKDSQSLRNGSGNSSSTSVPTHQQQSNYQIPAAALYVADEAGSSEVTSVQSGESSASDPLAMMEYYMKKAAQEERKRPPKHSRDEMPPPASLQAPTKRGHHMGDYIPPDELEKFLATCKDPAARKAAREAAESSKIQADNVGHKLLSKMGWREGEGLGSSRKGMADPIMAGDAKKDNLGVGAHKPGEVLPEDDIYEQYKKRMMLGYRHRPNPLGNPRKAYY